MNINNNIIVKNSIILAIQKLLPEHVFIITDEQFIEGKKKIGKFIHIPTTGICFIVKVDQIAKDLIPITAINFEGNFINKDNYAEYKQFNKSIPLLIIQTDNIPSPNVSIYTASEYINKLSSLINFRLVAWGSI